MKKNKTWIITGGIFGFLGVANWSLWGTRIEKLPDAGNA